jgi:hypothetical protein
MQESNKFGVVKKILVDFIKQRKTDKLALSMAEKNSAPVPCAISLKIPALKSPALPMPMVYTFILLLRKDCHFVDGWYRQRRQCAA